MMTTTLSLYDALGEDQLQGINCGRCKCSAKEANKAMGNAFVGGFVGGLPGGFLTALGAGGAGGLATGAGYWATCWW